MRGQKSWAKTRKRKFYTADFETTTDPDDCRVWGYGLQEIGDHGVELGTDIDEFMNRIDHGNSVIYFHNLRFDGHFIIDWLLRNDYEHVTGWSPPNGSFTSLISDMGMFYNITIKFVSGSRVELRDSLKKIPFSVAKIATSFGMEVSKGDIDYHEKRRVGHVLTDEEKDYIKRDVNIVSHAMKTTLDGGHTKLTVGSDALTEYKKIIGERQFTKLFPVFGEKMDAEIRRAYRGGFTYADPRFTKTVQGAGQVYDVNSMYPAVMYSETLPYGDPEFVEGYVEPTAARPLTIFSVTFTAKIKPDHVPCIQIKGSSRFSPTEYLSVISEPTTLMVTNVDWQLYLDHYDIEVLEYNGGWRFSGIVGAFGDYVDKWSKVKEEATGGMREIAKLMLNSLYGKFATNPNVVSKYPVLEDDRVVYKRGVEEVKKPVYTAVGVFITSYARDRIIRAAQSHYDVFAYADTDSLHLLTTETPADLDIHKTRLGAWDHEYDFVAAMFLRAKAYLEKHADGSYTNRIAGLPTKLSERLTHENIYSGMIIEGKLSQKSVPGGAVLVNVPYELKY